MYQKMADRWSMPVGVGIFGFLYQRTMAEESFQLEQLLKKKYHEDIFAKTQECKELQRNNATLLRQLVCVMDAVQCCFGSSLPFNGLLGDSRSSALLKPMSLLHSKSPKPNVKNSAKRFPRSMV